MAKRFRAEQACFLCEKASNLCDGQRPCGRCVGLGIAHMCKGGENKYGNPLSDPLNPHTSDPPSLSPSPSSSHSSLPTLFPSPSPSSSSSLSPAPSFLSHPSPSSHSSSSKSLPSPLASLPVAPPSSSSSLSASSPYPVPSSSSSSSSSMEGGLPHGLVPLANPSTASTALTTRSLPQFNRPRDNELPLSQLNMNNYILNEIRKIKDDNRRLQEELLAVKMENLKLNSIFVQLQHYPPHSLSTALAVSSSPRMNDRVGREEGLMEKPMVVYDLRNRPPTILTTNAQFCTLVGYSMEEVIGSPWQKYIHHDYIDRTMAFLSHRANAPYIVIEQVYKHKDGHVFPTEDKHVLLHDMLGNLVADTVTIDPYPSNTPMASGPSEFQAIDFSPGNDSDLKLSGSDGVKIETSSPWDDPFNLEFSDKSGGKEQVIELSPTPPPDFLDYSTAPSPLDEMVFTEQFLGND